MPNSFAYLMLFVWPVLVLFISRGLPLAQKILVALLGGYLLLPMKTVINLPLLPSYDKDTAAVVAALLVILFDGSRRQRNATASADIPELAGWLPSRLFQILIAGMVLGALATGLTNSEALVYGPTVVPGMKLYDALSSTQIALVTLIPLFLGRKFLGTPQAQEMMLRVLVIAGLFYGLLAFWEVLMSPQLHVKIYGFFQHSFKQHIRGGSYRPIIFLKHGLTVAMFFVMTLFCAIAMSRITSGTKKLRYIAATVYLLAVLLACKSMGSISIALLFGPILLLTSLRVQMLWAAMIAVIFLSYPVLRVNKLIPVETVVSTTAKISQERANSLSYRLMNEALYMAKAADKPLLGWGTGDRARTFDSEGKDITTSDARWVVTLASGGWVLYASLYGLFCLPIILLARRRNRAHIDQATAALAMILSANVFDLFANNSITPLTFIFAGSLIGRLELLAEPTASNRTLPAPMAATTLSDREPAIAARAQAYATAPPARSPYAPVLKDHSGKSLNRTHS